MNDLLIEAIEDEDYSKAIELLEKGADPNALIDGEDPIIVEVSENDSFYPGYEEFDLLVRLLQKLVESGANLNVENHENIGLISLWFQTNIPINAIRKLIALGAKFENSKGDEIKGSLIGLSYALMSLDEPDYVINGLNMLKQAGARLAANDLGQMLINYFVHAQQDMSDEGDEEASKFIPFATAALEMDANIDTQGTSGHTILMRASMNVQPKIVEFLLAKGANPNLQSEDGNTALMFVSGLLPETTDRGDKWINSKSQIEVAQILLRHNADKSLINNRKQTALGLAKKYKNLEMVELLGS